MAKFIHQQNISHLQRRLNRARAQVERAKLLALLDDEAFLLSEGRAQIGRQLLAEAGTDIGVPPPEQRQVAHVTI